MNAVLVPVKDVVAVVDDVHGHDDDECLVKKVLEHGKPTMTLGDPSHVLLTL